MVISSASVSRASATALLVLCAALLITAPAHAHRVAEALSVIEFNPRTGNVEVVHTMNLHDLDHVFSQRLGKPVTVGDSRESLDAVADHIGKAFALARLDGTPIPLKLAGMETVRGDLKAYYEAPRPDGLKGLSISDSLLMSDLPDQTNRVNVELPAGVETLIFDSAAEAQTVRFGG